MKIGENIKECREKQGLTQQKLSEMVGVKRAAIHKYEKNLVTPSIEMIEKIADVLNVSPSYLIGYDQRIVNPEKYSDDEIKEFQKGAWDAYKDHIKQKNSPEYKLNSAFSILNTLGKNTALDYVTYLSKQEKYTTPDE